MREKFWYQKLDCNMQVEELFYFVKFTNVSYSTKISKFITKSTKTKPKCKHSKIKIVSSLNILTIQWISMLLHSQNLVRPKRIDGKIEKLP